jgi:hypothetical protein
MHRMVGRTVVIGDIPWVAQSAEAFLSKVSHGPTSPVIVLRVGLAQTPSVSSAYIDLCRLLQYCRRERAEWKPC